MQPRWSRVLRRRPLPTWTAKSALRFSSRALCTAITTPRVAEVTPAEYAQRRRHFLECLPAHSLVLLPAADDSLYSHDILWPHHQDALWYHLFGLRLPMRRQLEPPSSPNCEDVRVTLAVFAKMRDGVATRTLLCVPPVTTDPATLVWAAEDTPLQHYEQLLSAYQGAGESMGPESRSLVVTNEVSTVCAAVRRLIDAMAHKHLDAWATSEAAGTQPPAPRDSTQRLLAVMPKVYAAYPQQLRWDGRRYRLPAGPVASPGSASPQAAFHHPLEALFSTLCAEPFVVRLPRPLVLPQTRHRSPAPCHEVDFRYAPAAGCTPGLVPAPAVGSAARAAAATPRRGAVPEARAHVGLPIRRAEACAWAYRQVKCPSQVRQHLRSARATEDAFARVLRCAATTRCEHVLHCAFQQAVVELSAAAGAAALVRSAYVPVVASGGVRGSQIHYTDNDGVADPGDVVRVDAGVEVDGVPTDCTRTFPVGRTAFSPSQAALYEGLLRLQRRLLACLAPGVSLAAVARLHVEATRSLLCDVGVDVRRRSRAGVAVPPSAVEEDEDEARVPLALVRSCFCAHYFGHPFGLDLHEELDLARGGGGGEDRPASAPERRLQGGMMHTVEPGVYVPDPLRAARFGLTTEQLPPAFRRGIGLQIEDDILVLPAALLESPDQGLAEAAAGRCRWTRGQYLQHALTAFHRYFATVAPPPSPLVTLCDTRVALVCGGGCSFPAGAQNVVRFLFAQRVAMEGLQRATAALEDDVAAAAQRVFVPNPAHRDGPPVPDAAETGWYPYSIIVLTATIPKDVELLELAMRP